MKKLVLNLSALVALFSFSIYEIVTPVMNAPKTEYAAAYALGDPVGSTVGLVWPKDYTKCVKPSSVAPDPPLPRNVPHATWYNSGSPPARFQSDVRVTLYFDNPEKINKTAANGRPICGNAIFAYSYPDTKTIHLPNPCSYPQTDAYARLACHEMGHINGWPDYHGD